MPDKSSRASRHEPMLDRSASRASNTNALSLNFDDDEDFALAAMGISDSYRPAPTQSPPSRLATQPPPRPSSITKNRGGRDSFTLRHDGPNDHDGSSTSAATDPFSLSRSASISTVSSDPFADQDEESYRGPANPSHPYQMYPQNVRLARTASLATTSTAPVSVSSYQGPRRPTHPYMMYPQNTVTEPLDPNPESSNVGFPGSTDGYQRRIGPDGEDVGDLIGPHGHTEQLPPYTKYPDEAYHRKAMGIPAPGAPSPTAASTSQAMPVIPGAGGINLATRNPEFSSSEDLNTAASPVSQQSQHSLASDTTQVESRPIAAGVVNEKEPTGWRRTARKRVWGVVPCWAVAFAVIVLVMMSVVIGAVIGTLLGPRMRQNQQNPSKAQAPPCDYIPIQELPPDLPALPTGDFALPLMLLGTQSQCMKNTMQAQAWDCNMVFSQLSIDIQKIKNAPPTENYVLNFSHNDSLTIENFVYTYGMQPPNFKNTTLALVQDVYQSSRGPAWWFQSEYLKKVVVPEDMLSPSPPGSSKRGAADLYRGDFSRKGIATPGDRPWICYWDKTVFETFIYVTQNNSIKSFNTSTSGTSTATDISAADDSSLSSRNAIYREDDSFFDSRDDHTRPRIHKRDEGKSSLPPTTKRGSPSKHESDDMPPYSYLPKPGQKPAQPNVIKIMERRVPAAADTGYCRQYEIKYPGAEATPILNYKGNTIDIFLDETFSGNKARSVVSSFLNERGQGSGSSGSGNEMSDCGCMWWLGSANED